MLPKMSLNLTRYVGASRLVARRLASMDKAQRAHADTVPVRLIETSSEPREHGLATFAHLQNWSRGSGGGRKGKVLTPA